MHCASTPVRSQDWEVGESTDTAKVEATLKLSCAGNSNLLLLARNTLSHRTNSVYGAYAKFKLPLKCHFVGVTQG